VRHYGLRASLYARHEIEAQRRRRQLRSARLLPFIERGDATAAPRRYSTDASYIILLDAAAA